MRKIKDVMWGLLQSIPLPPAKWSALITFLTYFSRNRVRITYYKQSNLFLVEQNQQHMYVARKSRLRLFHRGILGRATFVNQSYTVPMHAVSSGDIVLDCGANIGEFARAMEQRGALVYAFEPERLEYEALVRNLTNKDSRAFNVALWSSTGVVTLNHANESGDSAVSNSENAMEGQSLIRSTTLDDWAKDNLPQKLSISLLKLEAEGGEVEILRGGFITLKRIKYVCADLGEATRTGPNAVPDATNFLLSRGFEVLSFSPARCMTVFRNLELTDSAS